MLEIYIQFMVNTTVQKLFFSSQFWMIVLILLFYQSNEIAANTQSNATRPVPNKWPEISD